MSYMKATKRNPYMGLNNTVCENPTYWCKLHQVWLSEEDVQAKKCMNKLDFDMIGYHKCNSLEKKEVKDE